MHKRKSFEHEREIRAITGIGWTMLKHQGSVQKVAAVDAGIAVQVSLDVLVERVFVAPTAPQ